MLASFCSKPQPNNTTTLKSKPIKKSISKMLHPLQQDYMMNQGQPTQSSQQPYPNSHPPRTGEAQRAGCQLRIIRLFGTTAMMEPLRKHLPYQLLFSASPNYRTADFASQKHVLDFAFHHAFFFQAFQFLLFTLHEDHANMIYRFYGRCAKGSFAADQGTRETIHCPKGEAQGDHKSLCR